MKEYLISKFFDVCRVITFSEEEVIDWIREHNLSVDLTDLDAVEEVVREMAEQSDDDQHSKDYFQDDLWANRNEPMKEVISK